MALADKADYTGKIFGYWTAISLAQPNNIETRWNCRCKCGVERVVSLSSLKRGDSKTCGKKCKGDLLRNLYMQPPGLAGQKRVLKTYKYHAKKRNLEWLLSDDSALNIMKNNCHYCNDEPSNISKSGTHDKISSIAIENGKFIYNGIDRLDNNLGYIADNCVPCCAICNHAKHTMSLDNFLKWIKKVSIHHGFSI